jgi:hypothetical protein
MMDKLNYAATSEATMPEPDREITQAINASQGIREMLQNISDDARLAADRLLGAEPQADANAVNGCGDGDTEQLHYCLREVRDQVDTLRYQVSRLMRV